LAAALERAFPPNARRRGTSTSSLSTIPAATAWRDGASLAGVLAYGNADEIVRDMAREVLPVVKHTPVRAGVNGTDPFCLFDPFLDDLKRLGFSGVQNFPTVGLIDGIMRANLEETGMSYALQVEMIALARAKDMLTTPYVFSVDDAQAMAKAGADVIVCHLGLTAGGTIGAHTGRRRRIHPAIDEALPWLLWRRPRWSACQPSAL
jgi:predicted TIM-barrel enzyme